MTWLCSGRNMISQHRLRHRDGGFTLLEIMVVIVIIGLLVSVVGPNLMGKVGTAKLKTARLQLEELAASLDLYALEVGQYPTTQQGLGALVVAPADVKNWHGPYLKKTRVPVDPWDRPYVYDAPGKHGAYDLQSYGADGQAGGEGDAADIVNWE